MISILSSKLNLDRPITTFEQLWKQIKNNPMIEQIKERFEKFCEQSKIEIPNYGEIKTDA